LPTPHTHDPALVVVSDTVGDPVPAFAPATGPSATLALLNPTTVIDPTHAPLDLVAVTVALLSGPGATAVQISDVPACVLVRCRSRQVRPPPVTPEKLTGPPWGPSEVTNATTSSFDPVVVSPPTAIEVAADVWCRLTCRSTLIGADWFGVVTVAAVAGWLTFPAASCAVTV
jgi:hypothetical protein